MAVLLGNKYSFVTKLLFHYYRITMTADVYLVLFQNTQHIMD